MVCSLFFTLETLKLWFKLLKHIWNWDSGKKQSGYQHTVSKEGGTFSTGEEKVEDGLGCEGWEPDWAVCSPERVHLGGVLS